MSWEVPAIANPSLLDAVSQLRHPHKKVALSQQYD